MAVAEALGPNKLNKPGQFRICLTLSIIPDFNIEQIS